MRRLIVGCTVAFVLGAFAVAGPAIARGGGRKLKPVTVPMKVFRAKGQVLAAVRIVIHHHPFVFLVDTGASSVVLASSIAQYFHLKPVGPPVPVIGVGGGSVSQPVRLSGWRIGSRRLPATTAATESVVLVPGIAGLLGSNVLSRFGRVTLDYRHGRLKLG